MKRLLPERALLFEEAKTETGTPLSTLGRRDSIGLLHSHTERCLEEAFCSLPGTKNVGKNQISPLIILAEQVVSF